MGYKYYVTASAYPYKGCPDISRTFETLDEAVEFIKKCQANGLVIIDLACRDFEVNE